MTLRDQIRQTIRPWRICGIAGLLIMAPAGIFAGLKKLGVADPGESWPLLVMLVLVGAVLLIVSVIGQSSIRCPKCRGLLGFY
jgi:hypothetical protein